MDYTGFWAERAKGMRSSDIRDAFGLAEQPGVISFAGGFPAVESFPVDLIRSVTDNVLDDPNCAALQYGATEGLRELREILATKMQAEGIIGSYENILVTNGSQQGLDLLAKVFVNPGDLVLVELPGYLGGLSAISNYEATKVGIPMDEEGVRTDLLEAKLRELRMRGIHPKFIYIVPNFQNPTGVTISLQRRKELLRLASEYDFLILEDNPYGELAFSGDRVPHLRSLDTEDRVIYLGSVSKVFIPGVRIGWIQANQTVIQKLSIAKQGTDLCSSSYGQKILVEVLKSGLLPEHIVGLRSVYEARRDAMLRALDQYMPAETSWTQPQGGFFVWLTLPEGIDAKKMLALAVQEKVAYVSGGPFHVDGSGHNTIRLAYSQASLEDITEGIRRLSRVISRRMEIVANF